MLIIVLIKEVVSHQEITNHKLLQQILIFNTILAISFSTFFYKKNSS